MEKLNFSIFGFLSDKDKKIISFLYKDLKRNFGDYVDVPFGTLFKYLSDKFGNAISLYGIYKFLHILRYEHGSLTDDYVWKNPLRNDEEEYFSSKFFWDKITDYILSTKKFKSRISDLKLSFSNGCSIKVYDFKSVTSISGLSAKYEINCDNVGNSEEIYDTSGSFFVTIKINDYKNISLLLDIYNKKYEEISILQPWGNFKNITIDGMIELFTKIIIPYYEKFFEEYLGDRYEKYKLTFKEKNENIMKKIIRITENDLEKIIKKLIEETEEMELSEGKKKSGTKLCARGKAAAKAKFKVYPSAYANGYAVQVCKGRMPGTDGKKKCSPPYC